MKSDKQTNIGGVLRLVVYTALSLLIGFVFGVPEDRYENLKASKEVFNIQVPNENVNMELEKSCNDELDLTSVFTQNMTNAVNLNINGYPVTLLDNTFGYISSIKDRYSVLQGICNTYIHELGLDTKNISEIDIYGKIESTEEKDRVSNLIESGEVSKEIYQAAVVNDDLSSLEVKIMLSEESKVEPDTVIEKTDQLYMGQSAKIEGVAGESIIYKKLVYNGLEKSSETILKEEMVKPPVDSIIKVGTKNPCNDGIAFLSRPTKGGYISSDFGEYRVKSMHKGIDIAKNYGENVVAAFDGKVISAGYNNGGYGNLIIIQHENNIKTYYAHLANINVKTGDEVKKDQIIGSIGSTGNSTGPHLHFELRVNEVPIDPNKYILQ